MYFFKNIEKFKLKNQFFSISKFNFINYSKMS